MCQVFTMAGEACAVGVLVDVAGDGGQGGAEFGWGLGLVGGGEWVEHPVVDLGVETAMRTPSSVSRYRLERGILRMRPLRRSRRRS